MEYLEGWELVPGHDDGGRGKISSTMHGCGESQSESEEVLISPVLGTEIPTEKEKEKEEVEILTPTIIAETMEAEDDPDPVSPISFENTKETTEFVDMKSPESKSKAFNEEEEEEEEDDQVTKDSDHGCVGGGGVGGFDLWKWSWGLTGIGALVFVFVLGASGPGIQHKNNMGSLKGYQENQRLKEMVSAVRGGSVPLTRAHITFGGYYDAPSLNH